MEWSTVIKANNSFLNFNLKEIWRYRDLLWLFVKRDIVVVYKQTILGPLWYILKPILTTVMFTFVFGKLASISTNGTPHIVFYLLGVTIWGYFADCLKSTSNTFITNQNIFGKVYFPRVIVPGSLIISNLGKFTIQLCIFFVVWGYYLYLGQISPNYSSIVLLPYIVLLMGAISLGFGMIFSSLTTKYRDLVFLLEFGVQLWMYITPVIYPISSIPKAYQGYIMYNPIASLVESMRYAFLGNGFFSVGYLLYSSIFATIILLIGFLVFSKVEKSFMDTV